MPPLLLIKAVVVVATFDADLLLILLRENERIKKGTEGRMEWKQGRKQRKKLNKKGGKGVKKSVNKIM